ncbi:rhodanese-like domain-containing protein [Metabacillus fastidiosus]|uniref:rhodanese-like domain-containing protein n=1 Tax=Metabacillus fastidiosus TaxID=1458 RepID=UPI003D2C1DD7
MAWLLIILGLIIVYAALNFFSQRRLMKVLTEEEFRAGYRKAQLIDVREQDEYEGGHILGSRNIPLSQLRQRYKEIRNDQPVYLYCQNTVRSGRAAQLLKKKGYTNLNTLKGGFKQWTGKIKTKK